MNDEQREHSEAGGKVSVSVWTTGKSGPRWRVRVSDEAARDSELCDATLAQALRLYRAAEAALARAAEPFEGEEPQA